MRHFFDRFVLSLVIVSGSQMATRGDTISTLASTGEGLSTGVVDPNFTITSAPSGAILNPGGAADTISPIISPAYAKPSAGTQWIGPNVDNSVSQPVGNYDFRTTFNLSGLDPSTANITGIVAADNNIADIKLNGVSLGIGGSTLSSPLNFTIAGGFLPGKNTLDFIVNNNSTGGPTALMVSEVGTASVPEPSTIAVLGLGALALLVRRSIESRARRAS
jgi:PEP-CTERM motif